MNDSDWGDSFLNQQGVKLQSAYNFTDFLTGVVSFYYSEALTKNLYGGFATGNVSGSTVISSSTQWPIARDRNDKVLQFNLLMKF